MKVKVVVCEYQSFVAVSMRGKMCLMPRSKRAVGGNHLERSKGKADDKLYFSMKGLYKIYSRKNIRVFVLLVMSNKSQE